MAFSQFKNIGDVAKNLHISVRNQTFIRLLPVVAVQQSLREKVRIVLEECLHRPSEAARCEMLISPVLYDIWLHYRKTLKLWSHTPLEYNEMLTGTPDYLIAKESEYGFAVVGAPILVAVEAKQDNFENGWGQCAAEMLAIQKLNNATLSDTAPHTVFGIVTNGEVWQFANLEQTTFTQEISAFNINDIDTLFGALSFIMEECAKQVTTGAVPHSATMA
jgi:hypothetical protein